jgi:hypothetical protein
MKDVILSANKVLETVIILYNLVRNHGCKSYSCILLSTRYESKSVFNYGRPIDEHEGTFGTERLLEVYDYLLYYGLYWDR